MASVPEALPVLLKDFSKAVLKVQPADIYDFAAECAPTCPFVHYIFIN